jgi:hypothetical protein
VVGDFDSNHAEAAAFSSDRRRFHERSSGIAVVLAEELGADVEIVSLPAGGVLVGLGRLIGIDSIVGRASR